MAMVEPPDFLHSGHVDWRSMLREAGAKDELAAAVTVHPQYHALWAFAEETGCWLYSLENIFDPLSHEVVKQMLSRLMANAPKRGKPNSPKDEEFTYRTLNATRSPCTCAYEYAGYSKDKHKLGQFIVGSDAHVAAAERARRAPEHHIPGLDDLATSMYTALRCRLSTVEGGPRMTPAAYPGYWVANRYTSEMQCIGEHHDADAIFKTDVWPSSILGPPGLLRLAIASYGVPVQEGA